MGLDEATLKVLALRGWQVLAALILTLSIPFWLSDIEQGYFYSFSSLIALQIFFELGTSQVIIQLVSSDYAHLVRNSDGSISGNSSRTQRLAQLVALFQHWYLIAAVAFFLTVSTFGMIFFTSTGPLHISVWILPWVGLVFSTAINLYLSASLSIIEACGGLARVAGLRLVQSLLGYALLSLTVFSGGGLWAVIVIPFVASICSGFWLFSNRKEVNVFATASKAIQQDSLEKVPFRWKTDIFPFQWRIAISWISGYLIFQMFTPLAFSRLDPIEAGRLGISLAIFSAVLTMAMSWVNTKVPYFSAFVSTGKRDELNHLFFAVAKRSCVFALLASVSIIISVAFLKYFDHRLVGRLAEMSVLWCLLIVTMSNCLIFCAAAYIRAHKEEPMVWVSLATGLVTFAAAYWGSAHGIFTMMISYTLINVLIAFPWTIYLFMRYYPDKTV
jgi:hypothetical protein